MTRNRLSEEDLGRAVVRHLREQGWTVYQEVALFTYGWRADIVAERSDEYMVVELKTGFDERLLYQAQRWSPHAHILAVSIFRPARMTKTHLGRISDAREMGIGVLYVDRFTYSLQWVVPYKRHDQKPELVTGYRAGELFKRALRPEHEDFANAGNADQRFVSPFQLTCTRLLEYVREHPGVRQIDAIRAIEHHYLSQKTAETALAKWIRIGHVRGIEQREENGRLCLYAERQGDD